MTDSGSLERYAALALTASIGIVSFNLLAAQVLFGVAAIMWVVLLSKGSKQTTLPSFAWALAGYAALTVISALLVRDTTGDTGLLSPERRASLIDLKQLLLFLMVPMVMRLLAGPRATRTLNVVIAIGAAAALLGVVEYAVFGFDHLGARPVGSLTHYMTYSGVIMLVLAAAVARILFFPAQIIWPAVAIPALVVALGATNTRGAWIGATVAIVALVAFKRPKLLLFTPVVVAIVIVLAPQSIKNRATSIVDVQDESNRDRIQMAEMGFDMVRDHPWFGVGPEMVGRVYRRYLRPNPVHDYNPHLHNVPVQIAAERGLPALAVWIVFVVLAAAGSIRLLKHPQAQALAASGVGAILAMLTAGLFEYNFGDSEFLMLFLALITLPFAAVSSAHVPPKAAAPTTPSLHHP